MRLPKEKLYKESPFALILPEKNAFESRRATARCRHLRMACQKLPGASGSIAT